MKKIIPFVVLCSIALISGCKKFDDSALWNAIHENAEKIAKLEKNVASLNSDVSNLRTLVEAIQKNDMITSVSPLADGSGYTIVFLSGKSIMIKNGTNGKDGVNGQNGQNGKDGENGKDGSTPVISVALGPDGLYYWTLNGQWLTDAYGNKILAQGVNGKDGENGADGKDGQNGQNGKDGADGENGKDGVDGQNGKDGVDGQNGKDGVTPRFKIEDGYWFISYDNEQTWTKLGKATGNNGATGLPGADGADGDSIFSGIEQDDDFVYFHLSDGTVLTIAKGYTGNIVFEDLNIKKVCVQNWDINEDGELSFEEARKVTTITEQNGFSENTIISTFSELRYFTSLKSIGNNAFKGCTNLWKITLPEGLESIGELAFYGDSTQSPYSVLYINMPESIKEISKSAFGRYHILNMTIGENVEAIAYNSFNAATIKNMYWKPKYADIFTTETIGLYGTFENLHLLTSCTANGFAEAKITNLYLDGEDLRIGNNAFIIKYPSTNADYWKNHKITVYSNHTTPPSIGSRVFHLTSTGTDVRVSKIYVPKSAVDTYKTTNGWKDYASYIEGYDFK